MANLTTLEKQILGKPKDYPSVFFGFLNRLAQASDAFDGGRMSHEEFGK